MGFPVGALIGSLSGGSSTSYNYNNSINSGFNSSEGASQSNSWSNGTEANEQAIKNAMQANTSAWENWQKVAEYNAEQARIQREWEERMANTQYQRAIQDMEKAGLNPILAVANGISGAGAGAGSSASMSVPNTFMSDTFANSGSNSASYNRAHGENSGESHGEGWSNSTNGLAEGLGQLGNAIQGIVGAINSSKGVEGAKDKLGEIVGQAGESAKSIGEGIINSWKRFKNGWYERNGHQQSGGGHRF